MNDNLQLLIDKGYSKEEVIKLSSFTQADLNNAAETALNYVSKSCTSVLNPEALFIGGQPGCGKSSVALNIKNKMGNYLIINIDSYRVYHPNYSKIEAYIKDFWKDKEETTNDSPGNDLANMTHAFSGAMTDAITELGIKNKYNMILEWGMREPDGPLKMMMHLKDNKYKVDILFVATNKNESYSACNKRTDKLESSDHIVRRVPKSFHDKCVQSLPDSIDIIYQLGKSYKCFDSFNIVNRCEKILWEEQDKESPGQVFKSYLE